MKWESQQLERFKNLTSRDLGAMLRENSTEYNFLEIKPKAERAIEAVASLQDNFEFWEQLPENIRTEINDKLDHITKIFSDMEFFDPKQNNAWSQRENIISQFHAYYRELYINLIERLNAFLGHKAYSKELSSGFGQEAKLELAEISRYRKEIEKIKSDVQSAQTVAGGVASTATALNFDQQANEHNESARNWLWVTIGAGIIVGAIALVFSLNVIFQWEGLTRLLDDAALLTIKIVILGIALIALRFSIKNYSAHKHLYVINKHRANILKSMEAFRAGATDEATKNTILLSAVGAAFGHMETGLITTKEGAGAGADDLSPELLSAISYLSKK